MEKKKGSLPSRNLRRLLRQLRKDRGTWCPLGKSLDHPPGEKGVRVGYEHFFDLLSVTEDGVRLQWMFPVHETEYPDLDRFVGRAKKREAVVKPLPEALRARADAVDDLFARLWRGITGGRLGVRVYDSEQKYALRGSDGAYWDVRFEGDEPVSAERREEWFLAWILRSRIWEREAPTELPSGDAVRARVTEAVSVERVLAASRVGVKVRTPALDWAAYLLEGPDAFVFGDTGEEGPSADWTSTYPEAIYDWLPDDRGRIEALLRRADTQVLEVNYAPRPR